MDTPVSRVMILESDQSDRQSQAPGLTMDTPVSRVMILARDRSLAERLHAALHTNNPALQTVQSGASCIVLGMREEELGELHSTISSVRTRHKGAIIAVVPFSRRARELAGALVDAVVWHDEIDDSLRNLVGRYRHNSLQHRFARALASAVAEDRQLALGLRRLCTLDPPAILVEDGLAALMHISGFPCTVLFTACWRGFGSSGCAIRFVVERSSLCSRSRRGGMFGHCSAPRSHSQDDRSRNFDPTLRASFNRPFQLSAYGSLDAFGRPRLRT